MGGGADISDAAEPCSECGTLTLREVLGRVEAPFAGLVCPECRDELDHGDDEGCSCERCALSRAERAWVRRLFDADANGGFREGFFDMVGEMDL